MVDNKNIKISEITQHFETMSYGDEEENVAEAIEWLKTKNNCIFAYIDKPTEDPNGEAYPLKYSYKDDILCKIYVPSEDTVGKILKKCKTDKWFTLDPIKRAELMWKFANEIKKKQNLFTQLEVVARGILSKETRSKPLTLLTEYLQFYSSFDTTINTTGKDVVVGIISDRNCLSALGCILGPALACGHNVILQTEYQLSVSAALLIDIANQVGIPEGTIKLIPGPCDNLNEFWDELGFFLMFSIFDDLYKEKYQRIKTPFVKVLNFYSSGIPMIVFDNCDLDSACQSIIEAAWGCKGLLPWSVRKILVQENIFENFVEKLKNIIDNISVGSSNKKNVDIAYPDQEVLEKMSSLTNKAKNEGVEVYHPKTNKPYPVLLIGNNVFNNNVIKEDIINVPIVTITAFRTINEAVALANNTRHGLAASVWTENSSLTHEIVRKLKVANIWINSHGLFTAELSNSPYKNHRATGHFGGKDGLLEYCLLRYPLACYPPASSNAKRELMEKAISEAKKAQENWPKLRKLERIEFLQNIVRDISTKKNGTLPEEWLNEWISLIYEFITLNKSEDGFKPHKNFNVVSMREPCGIIAVETSFKMKIHQKKLIIASLVEGNSVIILNDSKEAEVFYSFISALFPKGVLTVLPFSENIIEVALLHKELNAYFRKFCYDFENSLMDTSNVKFTISDDWNEVYKDVTLSKNVWFNVGQSFN